MHDIIEKQSQHLADLQLGKAAETHSIHRRRQFNDRRVARALTQTYIPTN